MWIVAGVSLLDSKKLYSEVGQCCDCGGGGVVAGFGIILGSGFWLWDGFSIVDVVGLV